MITIWKYVIPIKDHFELEMPFNSKILSFQLQKGVPMIWCQVNTDLKLIERKFRLCGTEHELENKYWKFIGTIQLREGNMVFHLFEKEVI